MMPVDCSQARTLDLSIESNVMCDTFPTKPNEKAHFCLTNHGPASTAHAQCFRGHACLITRSKTPLIDAINGLTAHFAPFSTDRPETLDQTSWSCCMWGG